MSKNDEPNYQEQRVFFIGKHGRIIFLSLEEYLKKMRE